MTRCGDLFRYVPRVTDLNLPVSRAIVEMLEERDRMLEDYLSSMVCGGGGGQRSLFYSGSDATDVPGTGEVGDWHPFDTFAANTHNDEGLTVIDGSATDSAILLNAGVFMVWAQVQGAEDGKTWALLYHSTDYATGHYSVPVEIPAGIGPSSGARFTHTFPAVFTSEEGGYVEVLVRQDSGTTQSLQCDLYVLRLA